MQDKKLNLISIIEQFIDEDPLLSKHINYDPDDEPTNAEIIGTCYPKKRVQYAIGCAVLRPDEGGSAVVYVWRWTPHRDKKSKKLFYSRTGRSEFKLYPGDPKFFEKLKTELLRAHDSLSDYHKCKKLWKRPRA